uniref:PMS1 homolog 2, mismatch repair system component n=1 Tax=Oryzias latipes TaxID=8090 RepID=A0A3P9IH81_ORYLA
HYLTEGLFVCSEPAGAIKAIDKHSVHQICSGQVVLSLATAVKELVENSVDAGATNIDIKLRDCGVEQIEVSDNGKGVKEANFEGLTLKHHTSKLRDFSDLIHVETFGFRGEALSSLCALSVITCHESSQVGTKLVFDHKGQLVQKSPHPRQQGTTVALQQLFHTLPVRHKEFQRNIKKEYAKMIHVLQAYCIISAGVRLTCSNQSGRGKRVTVLSTSGSQSMRENIGAIFGPKQLQSLLPFQQTSPSENVLEEYGLSAASPASFLAVTTALEGAPQTGSSFSSTTITKVVNEVYHSYNRHQYPFVALNIAVASECVDVNVTPDKRQIFLQEEKVLLATLKTSIINMYEAGVNKISLNLESVEPSSPFPGSSMNLAALKAAFSSSSSSSSEKRSSTRKDPDSGPTQKTLRCFFKDPGKPASGPIRKPPSKNRTEELKAVESQVLEDRGPGRMSCTDADSDEDTSCDFIANFQSSENKAAEDSSDVTEFVSCPGEPDEQMRACSANQDRPVSPEAKKARREEPDFPAERKSDSFLSSTEESSATADTPVCLQKTTAPLQFSLQELMGNLKLLQEQRRKSDGLQYRRFRAKINPGENQSAEEELRKEISKDMFKEMKIIGQFNLGFIITKLNSDIFIIDQHATDEKYNFEMLQQHTVLQGQKLIAPQKLHLTAISENVLMENIEVFRKNGFEFLIDEDAQVMERVKLVSLPTSKNWTFGPADIEELIFMLSDSPGVMCRPSRVRQMFASRACRKSVMIGTALSVSEMKKLVVHMGEIEHPWNCPHGRPTMRHLANLDIISQD